MCQRPVFIARRCTNDHVVTEDISFKWHPGFSHSQKTRNVLALHKEFKVRHPHLRVLEISTKSQDDFGISLSAFNLMIHHSNLGLIPLESAYQGSKVFKKRGPFIDIYTKDSYSAKKDTRLLTSGDLIHFWYHDTKWPLEPKTLFYDWLYLSAIKEANVIKELSEYDAFTDIEFNPKKSFSCQAKSAALAVSLFKNDEENWLPSKESFFKIYQEKAEHQGELLYQPE